METEQALIPQHNHDGEETQLTQRKEPEILENKRSTKSARVRLYNKHTHAADV
jgi:hypothetical protein